MVYVKGKLCKARQSSFLVSQYTKTPLPQPSLLLVFLEGKSVKVLDIITDKADGVENFGESTGRFSVISLL